MRGPPRMTSDLARAAASLAALVLNEGALRRRPHASGRRAYALAQRDRGRVQPGNRHLISPRPRQSLAGPDAQYRGNPVSGRRGAPLVGWSDQYL